MTAVDPALRAPAPERGAPDGHPPTDGGGRGWPEPEPGPLRRAVARRPWLAPTGAGLAVALGIAYTAWQDPDTGGVFPGCPLRSLTGWDCPGCGGLRATHDLTRGDVLGALDHNVWVAVAVPLGIVAIVVWLLHTLGVRTPRAPHIGRRWVIGAVAVLLAFTVVRNIPGVAAFEYLNSFT